MKNITVILNGYKRGNQLSEQLDALNNGTVKPNEVLLWYNNLILSHQAPNIELLGPSTIP